jgi:hypothetical protein
MISTRYKFIFLHVPKTAGNAVQSYLLPYGDDQKVVHPHQDGIERFDVRGAVTPTKHATLQSYFDVIGAGIDAFAIIMPIRDPFDRALSLYFSPHRASGKPAGFKLAYDRQQFDALIDSMPAMVDYLRVDGILRKPAFILRFDSLAADLADVATHFGLAPPQLPILNRSLDQHGEREKLRTNPDIAGRVRQRFAEDYEYFGF